MEIPGNLLEQLGTMLNMIEFKNLIILKNIIPFIYNLSFLAFSSVYKIWRHAGLQLVN